jgi:hypothetical protein
MLILIDKRGMGSTRTLNQSGAGKSSTRKGKIVSENVGWILRESELEIGKKCAVSYH